MEMYASSMIDSISVVNGSPATVGVPHGSPEVHVFQNFGLPFFFCDIGLPTTLNSSMRMLKR